MTKEENVMCINYILKSLELMTRAGLVHQATEQNPMGRDKLCNAGVGHD